MSKERKPYSGRLAFDPGSDFHVDPDGDPVVTLDGGKTWVYAVAGDTSHHDRYHSQYAAVNTTANADEPEPHHFEVQPDDPHFGGLKFSPDKLAAKETSHTEAWA